MAPDIWFDFLRTNRTEALMDICAHNRRDIRGLASIFAVMALIAAAPVAAYQKYLYDAENLSLRWHNCFYRRSGFYADKAHQHSSLRATGKELLHFAAEKGWPGPALTLALHLLRSGFQDEGRRRLRDIAAGDFPLQFRISALRSLAIDSEHYRKDSASALEYTDAALCLELTDTQRKEFERRRHRLTGKLAPVNHSPP
jgi:hypothetical protein